ncbi:uncharacterized protein BDR25DRAFT_348647 [Lindgomyces ingoldianus]|uniref:Uncharacterized protein n=1 Tax=Lindgomyces ingoldianus TaxID=673940 RepID=A0ACB6RI42_9PLEO|nr:uncharacterized protein BDR25DRAFT_348647 [Lindgomyces ingoldianus]KAF2478390.1 hypothetical protein BDR25DRAFT_348647 [Lindgomyces ingoldianus]
MSKVELDQMRLPNELLLSNPCDLVMPLRNARTYTEFIKGDATSPSTVFDKRNSKEYLQREYKILAALLAKRGPSWLGTGYIGSSASVSSHDSRMCRHTMVGCVGTIVVCISACNTFNAVPHASGASHSLTVSLPPTLRFTLVSPPILHSLSVPRASFPIPLTQALKSIGSSTQLYALSDSQKGCTTSPWMLSPIQIFDLVCLRVLISPTYYNCALLVQYS